MSSVPCFQVDAFTDRPFAGNPAAVCLLQSEGDSSWMQQVAAEMNLSETAFVRPLDGPAEYELRWFTPKVEVDLCGHATLASAHTLWEQGLVGKESPIRFHTRSGVLTTSVEAGLIRMDFPSSPPKQAEPPTGLLEALDVQPIFTGQTTRDQFLVLESEDAVRGVQPDFTQLRRVAMRGAMITARSETAEVDFVSRFFAPGAGIDEDPVTGSAHCSLAPYWAEQLQKSTLVGFQASARGGLVQATVDGDRVILGGNAVTVWRGELL